MAFKPMKPETIARRARERAVQQREGRESLLRRLEDKVRQFGPDSIWAEMLDELRKKANPDVPPEGAREHVINALAAISAQRQFLEMSNDAMTAHDLREWLGQVEARLRRALEHLGHVYTGLPHSGKRGNVRRGNPPLMVLGSNPRVEDATIATWAKLEYMRPDDPDGADVVRVHEFKDGFEIGWLSDGTVQLSHPRHALWMDDEDDQRRNSR